MKTEQPSIFNYLDAIYVKKDLLYNHKNCSSYILSLWLSHDKELLPIVAEMNAYQFSIPDELIYKYYWYKVPKGKRWIKWTKKNETKEESQFVQDLKQSEFISTQEAKMFKKLFTLKGRVC